MSSKIETLNAHFIDPLNPDPADIRLEDIAHSLSMQCRFGGYTSRHYSVAEHSVYVARQVALRVLPEPDDRWSWTRDKGARRIVRQAVLHDATEAYMLDIPLPIKRAIPEYKALEEKLWATIARVFDVDVEMHPFIKEADRRMCSTEKLLLLSKHQTEWEWGEFLRLNPPYVGDWDMIDRYPVLQGMAKRRFLDFFANCKDPV